MNKWNEFLKILLRVLRPGAVWTILLMLVSGAAVIFILAAGRQESVFAYIIYVVSAYALTSLIVSFPKMRADTKNFIETNKSINRVKTVVYNNKYGNLFVTDVSLRVKIGLYGSLLFSFIYAGYKLFAAFQYASFWFGAEAVFYIVVSFVLFILLRNVRKDGTDLKKEYRVYRFCGYLLFALNAALTGVVYQMINHGMKRDYPGLMIYAAAIFVFYCVIGDIIDLIRYRKYNSPVLSAAKQFSFARSLVAMFGLQTAMFGTFNDDELLERIMNNITGGLVCCAIFAMAVIMVVNSFKKLKALNENN
jgi:hypothetical protein